MIISHEHRFIFIHVTKCAVTSVTHALLPLLGAEDIVLGCTREGEKLSEGSRKRGGLHKHSTATQARAMLGEQIWRSYYKFSFVRNPWDILVSTYHWWLKTPWDDPSGTREAVAAMQDFEEYALSPQCIRQTCTAFVSGEDGEFIVDFIGRHEHLADDFAQLCRILALPALPLGKRNATRHAPYRRHFNPLTRDLVGQWFKADTQAFGYAFDMATTVFDRPARCTPRKLPWLIVHCYHHRVATVWFGRLLRRLAREFAWNFQSSSQAELADDTDIFLQNRSIIDRFIEIRFEDFARDERAVVAAVLEHHGLDAFHIERALHIVEHDLSFERLCGRPKGHEDRSAHFRKGQPGDWCNYFSIAHKALFKQIYPGALSALGYEPDDRYG